MMRIAYVINSVEGGGAALPVPRVVELLRHRGATVRLFALTLRDGRALPALHRVGLETVVRDGGERDHAAAYRWLDRRLSGWQPDLIWTSLTRATLLGQIVGARRGLPVVSWQHSAFLKPANLALLRATSRLSALWIGDSHSVSALTAERLGITADRLATWPLFAADPAAPVAAPWRPGETIRIGSLGRLHPVKGYDVLLAALARLRADGFVSPVPFSVTIAGEGGERSRLAQMAQALGVSELRLPGFTADPQNFLAGLHLYLQPSRAEGLCVAAHEAMQARLPIVASRVGELPLSIVSGATGLVVPPGDPEALALALRTMLAAPELLAPRGEAARTRLLACFGADAFVAAADAVVARLPVTRSGVNRSDVARRDADRSASRVPIDRSA